MSVNPPIEHSNHKTVLVTGITGFIASVLGGLLLKEGYHVRGTTRRAASAKPLVEEGYGPYKERVEIFEVPDIIKDGAFDEAVKGVDAIFHTASPVSFSLDKYEDVIEPALHGTTSILKSALEHAGPQLKSVIVTSSVAALFKLPLQPGARVNEESKVSVDLEQLKKDIDAGKKPALYGPSKIAAYEAVWKFREEKKPPFTLTTIHPSIVIGPPVQLAESPEKLNETLKFPFNMLAGKPTPPTYGSGNFVDVRDVAKAHLLAYEKSDVADGQAFIVSGGYGPNQAAIDILRELYPGQTFHDEPGRGTGVGYKGYNKEMGRVDEVLPLPETPFMENDKIKKVLGLEFIDFKSSLKSTVLALEPLLEKQ